MRRFFQFATPFIVILILFAVLYRSLFSNITHEMPSALLNQSIPSFSMANVLEGEHTFSSESFKKNRLTLLNIWATWCYACRLEHDTLMHIKNDYHIPIYAIAYKDDLNAIASWLKKRGNPYTLLGVDNSGDVVIDFGIYGTPETFLIDATGKVLYRHVGALTDVVWTTKILPIVKQYEKQK